MKVAVLKEAVEEETRVAATPETVKKLIGRGAQVAIEAGAGAGALIPDAQYEEAGATIAPSRDAAAEGADAILSVRRPDPAAIEKAASGVVVVGMLDPYGDRAGLQALAEKNEAVLVSMELMPRITRAQVMDVLSSQANLAGYQAVIEGAAHYGRAFPMMMTAAGTVPAARVFVMGAGVAGLQAIATARRLGAVVSATDVRPAAKEQVESLAAKFIAVEDEEFRQAETSGGYAKEMSEDYRRKQAELVAAHIAKQDIVITTALIPGRPAPQLVSQEMVESMRPGSVLVDLAVERGGNVALAKSGEVVEHNGVRIVGFPNMAGRIPASASALYARNLLSFLDIIIDKETGKIALDRDAEILDPVTLARGGALVHPSLTSQGGAS